MILRTALFALAFATAAQAAPHGQSDFVTDYDTNKDGAVAKAEFDAIRTARLAGMDTNADGKVDEAEYLAEYLVRLDAQLAASSDSAEDKAKAREGQIAQTHVRFGVLDKDKDKDLSAIEFNDSGDRSFAGHDGDGDGVVKAGEPKKNKGE